ncbi:MAG: aspartyl protease family protein [Terriglobia bacterium]
MQIPVKAKQRVMISLILLPLFLSRAVSDTLESGEDSFRKGDFETAAKVFLSIVQEDSKNETAQRGLIRSLLREDKVEEAEKSATSALEFLPASSIILSALGDVMLRKGEFSQAEEMYTRAVRSNPQNGRAYLGLAKIHSSSFNRKSSRLLYQKAYECDPADPEIILSYAHGLGAADQIPLLEKYLEVGTNEPEFRRDGAEEQLEYLKAMGDRRTWILQGDPRESVVELQPMWPTPKRQIGYKLKARINGRNWIELQLDTGARGVLIHRKLAEKLQVQMVSGSRVMGAGDEGKRKAFVGLADSIEIGGVQFKDCTIHVSDKKLVGDFHGLIGSSVFAQFLICLNLPKNQIQLQPLPPIQGKRYDDPHAWSQLDRTAIPELAEMVPARNWGHILLDTLVNGRSRGFFILDTGAAESIINLELAQKVTSLQPAGVTIRGLSGDVKKTMMAQEILLQVGNFRQQNDGMLAMSFKKMSKDVEFEISGLLGYPLLSQILVYLDYRDGLVNLVYPTKKSK